MKFRHPTMVLISGFIWFIVGTFLMNLGLNLLMSVSNDPLNTPAPLVEFLVPFFSNVDNVVILCISIGLFIGFFKGRFVLGKSAQRITNRIQSFPDPMPLKSLYSGPYYILLGSMMFLGMSIKYMGIPSDIRGTIDVAIGAALINGAIIFYKMAMKLRHKQTTYDREADSKS